MPLPRGARATLAAVLLLLAARGAASEPRGPESPAERDDQPAESAPLTERSGGGQETTDGRSPTDGAEAGRETAAKVPPVNGAAEEGEDGRRKEKETEAEAGHCSTVNGVRGVCSADRYAKARERGRGLFNLQILVWFPDPSLNQLSKSTK